LKIQNARRRRAISPVLATVILIAITLIAAIAIAGFVFGLFGTFTSGQHLQLSTQTCNSATDDCVLAITNTGGAAGSVTGCSIYGTAGYSGQHGANLATPVTLTAVTAATVTVPAGTTSASPIYVDCTSSVASPGTGSVQVGAAVTGSLVVASGSPLSFSAIGS